MNSFQGPHPFQTTQWSLISKAKKIDDTTQARQALEKLCEDYWFPIYAFIRRKGHQQTQAEDLTQGFFLHFIEKPFLDQVSKDKGKFRSYLLVSVKNFMANEYDKTQALKRGGGKQIVSLNAMVAESWYEADSAIDIEPEAYFDRQWAISLIRNTFAQLEADYRSKGRKLLFNALKGMLNGETRVKSYAKIAEELNMTESSVKVAAHRLKQRYRSKLKQLISETLNEDSNLDEELNYLFSCL